MDSSVAFATVVAQAVSTSCPLLSSVVFENSSNAWPHILHSAPALVIAEVELRGGTGFDLARAIRDAQLESTIVLMSFWDELAPFCAPSGILFLSKRDAADPNRWRELFSIPPKTPA